MVSSFLKVVLFASIVVPGSAGGPKSSAVGTLIAIRDGSISIKNDNGTFVFHVNSDTRIWRGGSASLHQLRLGDDVAVRYRAAAEGGEAIATDIEANVDKWEGTITKVRPHSVQVDVDNGHDSPVWRATIFIDGQTIFDAGTPKDLQAGRFLEVIGLDMKHRRMRATRILSLDTSPTQ